MTRRHLYRSKTMSARASRRTRGPRRILDVPARLEYRADEALDAPGDQVETRPGHPECENHIPRRAVCHNLRWAMITMTAPTKAANTVGNIPPPAETPRAIQPPTTLPTRPSTISPTSPYPPSFITKPVTQPASTPTTTHHPNIPKSMTPPPSPRGGSAGLLRTPPDPGRLDTYHNINYITSVKYIKLWRGLPGVNPAGRR